MRKSDQKATGKNRLVSVAEIGEEKEKKWGQKVLSKNRQTKTTVKMKKQKEKNRLKKQTGQTQKAQ